MSGDNWQKLATDAIDLVRGWEIDHRCNDCPPHARLVDLHRLLTGLRDRQRALEAPKPWAFAAKPVELKPEERFGLLGPGGITWVDKTWFDKHASIDLSAWHQLCRPDQPRFWILADEFLEREREARADWMRAAGMV